jgi:TetR/AcrR family transcriptional repressor of lmrAB and yxaGH operons
MAENTKMPNKSDSRKRIIRTMSRLLQRQGYAATGLNQVVEQAEAPKGSLYFHFPGGKAQLASESVAASGASIRRVIEATLQSADDPATAVRRLANGLGAALAASGYTEGCPIATVALEEASSDRIRTCSAEGFQSWEAAIAARFVEFGWPEADAASSATLILSALEGALILSRAYRSTEPLSAIAEGLAAALLSPR